LRKRLRNCEAGFPAATKVQTSTAKGPPKFLVNVGSKATVEVSRDDSAGFAFARLRWTYNTVYNAKSYRPRVSAAYCPRGLSARLGVREDALARSLLLSRVCLKSPEAGRYEKPLGCCLRPALTSRPRAATTLC